MNDNWKMIILVVLILAIVLPLSRFNRAYINEYFAELKKVDDATTYKSQKKVEDSCRSMIASYKSDAMTYDIYKDSENEEKQSWAEQARIRANKTAIMYNEYILKNSFVWKGNIPDDICSELHII